MTSYNLPNFSA